MIAPRCLTVGRVEVDDRYDRIADQPSRFVAHQARAFAIAIQTFQNTYGRLPDFDILNFRGMYTTTDIVCEIWEEA